MTSSEDSRAAQLFHFPSASALTARFGTLLDNTTLDVEHSSDMHMLLDFCDVCFSLGAETDNPLAFGRPPPPPCGNNRPTAQRSEGSNDRRASLTCTALYQALHRRKQNIPKFFRDLVDSACYVLEAEEASLFLKSSKMPALPTPPADSEVDSEPALFRASRRLCRSVLANAFLLNIKADPVAGRKDGGNRGGLMLGLLLGSSSAVAVEKAACFVEYFVATAALSEDVGRDWLDEDVTFRKVLVDRPEFRRWLFPDGEQELVDRIRQGLRQDKTPDDSSTRTSQQGLVVLHDGPMETPSYVSVSAAAANSEAAPRGPQSGSAHAFVNFANRNFGYGKFIASCTQEEILQVCCPELNVGMLYYGMTVVSMNKL